MAKEREQKVARILYVEQGKTAKEISPLINVSEATISKWVNKFGWRDHRNARLSNPSMRTENIRSLINELSEQRLDLSRKLKEAEASGDLDFIKETRKNIAQVDDGVSKWNKTLENITSENRISLSVYLTVMDMVFEAMKAFDEALLLKTVDFQEYHLNDVSLRFK